jgi:DNA-binding Lrp family transcriptional regulator
MIAKSLDIVVMLKLLLDRRKRPYAQLSKELGISGSEIHAAVRRGADAGLIDPESRLPLRRPLEDYLLYGVRYAFPAKPGPVTRGIPTAYAAPPLSAKISSDDLPPVWPDPHGTVKGVAVEPLYSSVTRAVKSDSQLYELLALVDALRIGRARECNLAEEELKQRIIHAISSSFDSPGPLEQRPT